MMLVWWFLVSLSELTERKEERGKRKEERGA